MPLSFRLFIVCPGPVVSRLVDAERGEAEARAIYRQVKAREASGDLQVQN